jgi:LPXTG-motif cell wall-anchored protein
LTVAAVLVGPPAAAQVIVPRGGEVDINTSGRTGRTERTPGTGRTPGTPGTPGTDRIPSTQGRTERTPGTGRTPGTPGTGRPGAASRLPTTGSSAETMALDGLTLLGAGVLALRYRRRLLA